jgi:single-stranded-DNA-specific exonuclease
MARYAAEVAAAAGVVVQSLECDTELRVADLSPDFFAAFKQLAPFGNGNAEPIFLSFGLRLAAAPKFFGERHVRFEVEDVNGSRRFGAVAWGRRIDWASRVRELAWAQGARIDLAYKLHLNRHKDWGGWELEVVDLRPATHSA